jgi:uncharacterized membrane protein YhiD involved in acid resistance
MIFAEGDIPQWLLFLLTGTGAAVLTQVANWLKETVKEYLNRKDKEKSETEKRDDAEEETALTRLRAVMELREEDCNKRIEQLTRRVDELERSRDARQIERDAMRDKLAIYAARIKYQDKLLKKYGETPDDWDKPETGDDLPAVNLPSRKED